MRPTFIQRRRRVPFERDFFIAFVTIKTCWIQRRKRQRRPRENKMVTHARRRRARRERVLRHRRYRYRRGVKKCLLLLLLHLRRRRRAIPPLSPFQPFRFSFQHLPFLQLFRSFLQLFPRHAVTIRVVYYLLRRGCRNIDFPRSGVVIISIIILVIISSSIRLLFFSAVLPARILKTMHLFFPVRGKPQTTTNGKQRGSNDSLLIAHRHQKHKAIEQ